MAMPFLAYLLRFRQGASKRNGSVTVVKENETVRTGIAPTARNALRTNTLSEGEIFLLADRVIDLAIRPRKSFFRNSPFILPITQLKKQEGIPAS